MAEKKPESSSDKPKEKKPRRRQKDSGEILGKEKRGSLLAKESEEKRIKIENEEKERKIEKERKEKEAAEMAEFQRQVQEEFKKSEEDGADTEEMDMQFSDAENDKENSKKIKETLALSIKEAKNFEELLEALKDHPELKDRVIYARDGLFDLLESGEKDNETIKNTLDSGDLFLSIQMPELKEKLMRLLKKETGFYQEESYKQDVSDLPLGPDKENPDQPKKEEYGKKNLWSAGKSAGKFVGGIAGAASVGLLKGLWKTIKLESKVLWDEVISKVMPGEFFSKIKEAYKYIRGDKQEK